MTDSLNLLMQGFESALTPTNLLFALVGVMLGTAVGVLPGIGPAMTVALLLPLTYSLDPASALIMFAGIYYGGMYGGSTTSILLNTPGEASSVMTAIEGNKMARKGRAAQALATAAIGSFVAGTLATGMLVLVAPLIVDLAIQITPADYFALMLLAFAAVTLVLGASKARGVASLGLGLMIGLIGIDASTGQDRLTFGLPQLLDGVDVVVVAVGIFGVGEALWIALWLRRKSTQVVPVGQPWMNREDFGRSWKPWLRGTAIGFPFGAMPAGGAEIPTYLSYVTEKKLAKNPEEFGHGAIEGVAGPEAANNASAAGVLVPLLTLGLPTSATAAVLLAAFQQFGLQPGPLLLDSHPDLVWGLIASLFIGNTLLLLLNLPLAPLWAKLLRIPRPYLYAGILFFASLGAYASEGTTTGLYMLLVAGLLGLLMRRFGLPVVPLIIGVILGPRAELQLRRALQLSDGDLSTLVASPTAITLYGVIALMLLLPLVLKLMARSRSASAGGPAGPDHVPGPQGSDPEAPDADSRSSADTPDERAEGEAAPREGVDQTELTTDTDSERDEVRR